MKIAYLTTVAIPMEAVGQSEQIQAMALSFYSKLGKDFLLISSKGKSNLDVPFSWKKISVSNKLPKSLKQLVFLLKSLPSIFKFRPDFVYTRNIALSFIIEILGFRSVYEAHQSFNTKAANNIFKLIGKRIKIVTISQALKDSLVRKYCLKKDNVFVAHDGVFLKDFDLVDTNKDTLKEKYLKKDKKDFICFYWGSLTAGKGVDLILESAKELKSIEFVFVGGLEDQIKDWQSKYSNLKNISFLGIKPHENMPYFTKGADLLILPNTKKLSYWEFTSPLKMFEYMASKVPILSSNLGSISEVLNEKNSILFKDQKDLVLKISQARDNYQEALKKSNQAFEDVKEYDWKKRIENILNFLN